MADRQLLELRGETSKVTVNREGNIPVLEVCFDLASLKELSTSVINLSVGHDLKMTIPPFTGSPIPVVENWVIYIKEAPGSDRSLLAHPAQNEWVGSLLLSRRAMALLRQELTTWAAGTSERTQLSCDELGRFTYPSNLRIVFKILAA